MRNTALIVVLCTSLLLLGLGARKSRRDDAGNQSVRTQQKAADSMSRATTQKSAPSPLEELDQQIAAEQARHERAMVDLRAAEQGAVESGKEKELAKVRKAIKREETNHQATKTSLQQKREKLVGKSKPDQSAQPPKPAVSRR